MSFDALLTELADVWERQAESDSWSRLTQRPIRVRITAVNAETAIRESGDPTLGVSHVGRCRPNVNLQAGRRLVRVSDGQEFEILGLRTHPKPGPSGQTVLLLRAVEAATS